MPHPSHPPWLDHPNNIWWSVQVMKLVTMQCSGASHNFLPLRSKYFPQHPLMGRFTDSESPRDVWNEIKKTFRTEMTLIPAAYVVCEPV
jgi:hypothetical protein